MLNWFADILYVVIMSKRIQRVLIAGMVCSIGVALIGSILISNFELQGQFKALEAVISEKFMRKYDKLAILILLSSWVVAIKYYLKDRHRF